MLGCGGSRLFPPSHGVGVVTAAMVVMVVVSQLSVVSVRAEIMDAEKEQQMVQLVKQVMQCREIPGLSMTLVKGKETKAYPMGVTKLGTDQTVKSKTMFSLGSITQSFTATLIAILTQRSAGVVHFDTPVEKLIGGELKLATKTHTSEVSLRDLLMHRTGLSAASISMLSGLPKSMTRGELISNLKELPQLSGIRNDFQFNSLMYTLAGHVAEKLTGNSWEALMRTLLLDKIGMTSTKVEVDSMPSPEFAQPYVSVDDELVELDKSLFDLGPLAPAGTLYSNAEDMGKAMRYFMGDPKFARNVDLPMSVLEEVMTPRMLLSPGYRASLDRSSKQWPVSDINVGYAMGFFRNTYRGLQVPWQSGSLPGYQSIMWLMPEKSIGIFIVINGQKHSDMPLATLQSLIYHISDLLLEEEPWVDQTNVCTFPEPFIKTAEFPDFDFKVSSPTFSLTDYVGTYANPLLGDMVVRLSPTNSKYLTFALGKAVGELQPEGSNVFRLFLEGNHKFMTSPSKGKLPIPFLRLFFEFKGPKCTGVKVPDSIFGGSPMDFEKKPDEKDEL